MKISFNHHLYGSYDLETLFEPPSLKDIYMNRDCWTRTNDPLVPNQMRYQAALNPDIKIGAGLNFYRHPHSNNRYSVTNVGNQYSQRSTVSWL